MSPSKDGAISSRRSSGTFGGNRDDNGKLMGAERLDIRREPMDCVTASKMMVALNAELSERYPEEGANHFRLDDQEVVEGRGAFLVAYRDGKPVGCAAIRRLGERTAEIKRMYVEPQARGRGVGRALLTRLEAEAQQLKVKRIVLETGERQAEALALYESAGFARIAAFGEYVGSPLSTCMVKRI